MKIQMNFKYQMQGFHLSINWESQENRIGILGASGSGKSMTLKALSGIITPDSGQIIVNDTVYFDSDKHINIPPQKRKIGYLFQNYALFPTMTVEKNISMGLFNCKKNEKQEKVNAIIEKLQLETLRYRYPHELSGGQQQRVALARILVYEPDLILLDEPFSALDTFLKDNLIFEMKKILQEYNGTMIMVSHSIEEIYTFSNYLFVIDKGMILENNYTKSIFQKPTYAESAKLTGIKNISSITKIDEHTCFAENWNITLHTKESISEKIHYVGFHSQDLFPGTMNDINSFSFQIQNVTETPSEKIYQIIPASSNEKDSALTPIFYKCNHNLYPNNQIGNYLSISPDSLFLLS